MIASLALVGVTAVWGYTFLAVQDAVARMPVMDFLAWRFLVASVVMIALRPTCLRNVTRLELLRGLRLGTVLGLGYIAQTYGLRYTSAAISGFITGMFVVLTPVMSWILLRRKTSRNTWMVVALATVGLALLSLNGWSVGIGELLTLGPPRAVPTAVGMTRMPAPARFLLPRIGVDEFVELPVLDAVSVRAGAPRTGS